MICKGGIYLLYIPWYLPLIGQCSELFDVFTNTRKWQCCPYCQLCIAIYLKFSFLFVPYDVCKCEIRYHWVSQQHISRLQNSSIQFLSNGTAKTKLATLTFLYCEKFVKPLLAAWGPNLFLPHTCNLTLVGLEWEAYHSTGKHSSFLCLFSYTNFIFSFRILGNLHIVLDI